MLYSGTFHRLQLSVGYHRAPRPFLPMSITDTDTASDSFKFIGHTSYVNTAAFSPDGKHVASGSLDRTIRLWDVETRSTVLKPFTGHTSWVNTVAFSPDGRYIVSGSSDHTLRLWDTTTGKESASPFEGHTQSVWSVAFSPDGQLITSGSYDKTVRLWDTKTGKTVFKPLRHGGYVTSVAFSFDGRYIISGSRDCTICFWDTAAGKNVSKSIKRPDGSFLGFSHDGRLIASDLSDGHMSLCDISTTENVTKSFQGHTEMVSSVAFSPDEKHIVSGSTDFTIRLWDTATGRTISGPYQGHTDIVLSVGFSSDGKHIVSTSCDRTIHLWRTPSSIEWPASDRDTPFSKWSSLCLDGKVSNRSQYQVASGGFADVWKGFFGGDIMAIKIIRPFGAFGSQIETSKLFKQLWREYRAWSNLSHPNVLDCLGFSYDFTPNQEIPSLISRWMSNGDVLFYLKKYPDADRLKIVIGIANGLTYLHKRNPVIVHGDLRAGNVLVSADGNPRLTDFGLSRVISQTHGSTTSADIAGSLRWMAPELFHRAKVSSQSDVWAYGMTVLEIFTSSRPFKEVYLDPVVIHEVLNGHIPERPAPADAPSLTDVVWTVCQNCWNMDLTQRPSMSEVYEKLTRGNGNA